MNCLVCQGGKLLSPGWKCNVCGNVNNQLLQSREEAISIARNFISPHMEQDMADRFVDHLLECVEIIYRQEMAGKYDKGEVSSKQKELAKKHGTPEQFEKAIWKAYADLFITVTEAWSAIRNYQYEWDRAG